MTDEALRAYASASLCSPSYMDFARIGPLLAPAERARDSVTRIVSRQPEKLDELDGLAEKVSSLASKLTGFRSDAVALSPNTSAALFHMAFSLPPGEVLVSPFDFPANVQPWLRAQEHGRARVRWMTEPNGTRPRITPELIASALTPQTTAVTLSVVDSYTGYQIDLDILRAVIGDRLLIVDGIQALGALDIPWQAADVVASGAQKWLRGGWGAGLLACSDRALERLGAGLTGWTGVQGASDPRRTPQLAAPRQDVQRFSTTAPDLIAVAGLAGALECLQAAGIGRVSRRVQRLALRCRELLAAAGARLEGPEDLSEQSGIVTFRADGCTAAQIVTTLAREGITVAERAGAVRVSLHASTTEGSIELLASVVADAIKNAG
ncbi:MAG TPA: aminotransferase class V-fold PLP-dependent enzyme [Trebonia sp.]